MITGLFRNWRFRTATPAFAPGETLRAYLTGFDPVTGKGIVRVGDTLLTVSDARAEDLDMLIDLRVDSFDATQSVGQATARRGRPTG